jgi:hypothetical protein
MHNILGCTVDQDEERRTALTKKRTSAIKTVLVLASALTCLLVSCTAAIPVENPNTADTELPETAQLPTNTITDMPEPVATPKSDAQVAAELEAKLERKIRESMRFDVAALLPEGDDAERLIINLDNNTEGRWMLDIRDEVGSAVEAAVARAEESCSADAAVSFSNQLIMPSWQYLHTLLLYAWEDVEAYGRCIETNLSVDVSVESVDGKMQAVVCIEPVYYRDALRSVTGNSTETYLGAEVVYAYMNTVFDEHIEETEYVLPPVEGNLAAGITWPLQRFTNLRKSWYAERDDGARKHTGTDIWAPENAEIYSCTAGTVIYIGTTPKGGNIVVILDDYGYIFDYCHMVRLTDFLREGQRVEAGQLIGYVGNTGNSACNHLHITIITPDGVLIDPYPYLLEVMPD